MHAVPADNIDLSPVSPATSKLGNPTLVSVVDTVPEKLVCVPVKVDMPVICPAICKLETDKVLLVLFQDKFADCKIDADTFLIIP
jgi:hypothetical protein